MYAPSFNKACWLVGSITLERIVVSEKCKRARGTAATCDDPGVHAQYSLITVEKVRTHWCRHLALGVWIPAERFEFKARGSGGTWWSNHSSFLCLAVICTAFGPYRSSFAISRTRELFQALSSRLGCRCPPKTNLKTQQHVGCWFES